MRKPSRRIRVALTLLAALALMAFVWWDEAVLWLPSRRQAQVEAMHAAFERDFESLSREEQGRRYRELIEADKTLPEARRRAFAWDQAQERHLKHIAHLRRFAAMTPAERVRDLDDAIDETQAAIKRSAAAIKQAKASGPKAPPPSGPVEEGRPIVFTAEELQLRACDAGAERAAGQGRSVTHPAGAGASRPPKFVVRLALRVRARPAGAIPVTDTRT